MLGGIVIYGVMAAENVVFEQELERKRRRREALDAFAGSAHSAESGIKRFATAVRDLVSGGCPDQGQLSGEAAGC